MKETSTNSVLGTLDLLILKTLSLGRNHGFGITLQIQENSNGLLRVEEGSLYPALHRLERDKLLKAEWGQTENGRRARYYSLTRSGYQRLDEATRHWGIVSRGVAKVLSMA